MKTRVAAGVIGLGLLVSGTACASTEPGSVAAPPAPAHPTGSAGPTEPAGPTEDELLAFVANTQWSFASAGVLEPFAVDIVDGTATDDIGRTYTVGEEQVATDLNGDGILDLVLTIDELDGNGFEQLWYAWIGAADGTATQIEYPLARSARCGDAVRDVVATDAGLRIDGVIYDPVFGVDSCAEGSTERFTRDVEFRTYDGGVYPVQTEPTLAWGGYCPRSTWQDGESLADRAVRVAPPDSSDVILEQGTEFLPLGFSGETPLLAGDGVAFFAFMHLDNGQAVGEQACAFAVLG